MVSFDFEREMRVEQGYLMTAIIKNEKVWRWFGMH